VPRPSCRRFGTVFELAAAQERRLRDRGFARQGGDLDGDDADQNQRAAGEAAGVQAIAHQQEAEQRGEDGFRGQDDRRVGRLRIALSDHLRGEADAHRNDAGIDDRPARPGESRPG
jgi:hypothetical protein